MFILFLKLSLLATVINMALTPLSGTLAKCAGYAAIVLSLAAPCTAVPRVLSRQIRANALCLVFIGCAMVCSLLVFGGQISADLIRAVFSFFCCYTAIVIRRQTHTGKDLKQILLLGKCMALVYVAYTYLPLPFRYRVVNEWGDIQFTMGMGNPNATAMGGLFCICLLLMHTKTKASFRQKALDYAMAAAVFGTLIKLQSRTVLLCCAALGVLYLLKGIRIQKYMIWAALAAPVVFIFLQMGLAGFGNIQILGKAVASGRNVLFSDLLNRITAEPLTYAFGRIAEHGMENYHNAPLTLIMSTGYLGYICYLLFWNTELKDMAKRQDTPIQRLAMCMLLVYFVHSSAESGPMTGLIPYGTQVVIIARMAKDSFVYKCGNRSFS